MTSSISLNKTDLLFVKYGKDLVKKVKSYLNCIDLFAVQPEDPEVQDIDVADVTLAFVRTSILSHHPAARKHFRRVIILEKSLGVTTEL